MIQCAPAVVDETPIAFSEATPRPSATGDELAWRSSACHIGDLWPTLVSIRCFAPTQPAWVERRLSRPAQSAGRIETQRRRARGVVLD